MDFRNENGGGFEEHGFLKHWQGIALLLMLYDVVAVNLGYFLALWLRFDCHYTEIPGDCGHGSGFFLSIPLFAS